MSNEIMTYLSEQGAKYSSAFLKHLPQLTAAILLILLTWGASRLSGLVISRLGRKFKFRTNLVEVLQLTTSVGIWMFGLLLALTLVFPTVTPGKALTTLGLGSVAVGFAFKDTFENFLAGILILLREPFELGDFVECESIEGQVEHITIRDTHIRQTDGQLVVVPNHTMFQNPVRVRTSREYRRVTIACGVGYGEDADHARNVILKAVTDVDSVRDDIRDVQVFTSGFGASSVDFEVAWWTRSKPIDVRKSRDEVLRAIKRALDDEGIEIPFPYRTLTFPETLKIENIKEHSDDDDVRRDEDKKT